MVRSFLPLLSLLIFNVAGSFLWDFKSLEALKERLETKHAIPNVQARSIAKEVENIKSKRSISNYSVPLLTFCLHLLI